MNSTKSQKATLNACNYGTVMPQRVTTYLCWAAQRCAAFDNKYFTSLKLKTRLYVFLK